MIDIKLKVETNDASLASIMRVVPNIPEGVSVTAEGPIALRDSAMAALLIGFALSVAQDVPSNVIANWIADLIMQWLRPRSETIQIVIKGKGVKLTQVDLENPQIKQIIADELEIQIKKSR